MNYEVTHGKTNGYHINDDDPNTVIFKFDVKSFNRMIYILEQMMIAGISPDLIYKELENLVNNPMEYYKQNPDLISKKFAKRMTLQNLTRLTSER